MLRCLEANICSFRQVLHKMIGGFCLSHVTGKRRGMCVQRISCFTPGDTLYGYVGKYRRSQSADTDCCGIGNLIAVTAIESKEI